MRAFVTGATGLLGNNLARTLVDGGHEVTALVRSPAKAARVLAGLPLRLVPGDILRVPDFADQLAGADAVFHTAAYFREAFEPGADEAALEATNLGATLALLEAADARGAGCFVHVGSGGVVGRKADGSPGDEDTPPLPVQRELPYFRSKLAGDAALAKWKRHGRTAVVEVLPGWIWGPWDAAPTAAGRIVEEFTSRRIPANVPGGTSIVDARDVALAMVRAAERALEAGSSGGVEKYVVGGTYLSMRGIMAQLEAATGVRGPRFGIPISVLAAYGHACVAWARVFGGAPLITPTAVHTMGACIALDSSKAQRLLGVSFRPVEETIRDTVEWRRAAGLA